MIVVTGATGLVGSQVVKLLSAKGEKVRAIYNQTKPIEYANVEWVPCNILNITDLTEVLKGVDYVYHCAALVSFKASDKEMLHSINVEGTANVVNACIDNNVNKLLHISSVAALAKKKAGGLIDEAMDATDIVDGSVYGRTKYLAEMEVWRGTAEGLDAVIVNPSIILGSGNWDKGSSAIFKNIYTQFPWYSNGVNGFVDVFDLANAMIQLMESDVKNQRFIVSAFNLTYKELFQNIATAFGTKPPHKKIKPFLAKIVWRLMAIKSLFTGTSSMITKETAETALRIVKYDNSKLLQTLPAFHYTTLAQSLDRICKELIAKYNLTK